MYWESVARPSTAPVSGPQPMNPPAPQQPPFMGKPTPADLVQLRQIQRLNVGEAGVCGPRGHHEAREHRVAHAKAQFERHVVAQLRDAVVSAVPQPYVGASCAQRRGYCWMVPRPRAVLNGKKKSVPEPVFPKKPAGTPCAHPWLVAVGGWRLAAVGGWQLATCGWWRLVVVGGGWWLVIGCWWRLAVVGSWRLVHPVHNGGGIAGRSPGQSRHGVGAGPLPAPIQNACVWGGGGGGAMGCMEGQGAEGGGGRDALEGGGYPPPSRVPSLCGKCQPQWHL